MKKRATTLSHSSMGNEASSAPEDWPGATLPTLPLEVLEEIFQHVPSSQVVRVCRLVCREWREVVDSDSLWRERCRREGYQPCDANNLPKEWRLFYFLCTKRRNLIKNCKADQNFSGWHILENGGDRWKIEPVAVPHPDNTVKNVFVTSYEACRKCQLIDLQKEGYCPSFMDSFQPDIVVSDWYAPRWDCGCEYEIRVELLNQKKKPVQTFSSDTIYFEQWNDQKWNQITHIFKNYGPGVRYIRFVHGGTDTQFWAGWYGIRVTNSSVEICPSLDR